MFSPIDLRWGITSEQSTAGQVINICLNACENSRPFFITCLGERYGWQRGPPPGEEGHDELYQRTLEEGKRNFPWIADYEDRAVTELEIMQAFLHASEQGEPVDTTYMHVYLRKPKPEHARDSDEPGWDSGKKLAALKERLRQSPVKPIEYETAEELGEYVLDDLTAMLKGMVEAQQAIASHAGIDAERQHHDFFGAKMAQFFVAGDAYVNAFSDHFGYEPGERQFKLGTPLLIAGPTGAGKSTVAAALASWGREKLHVCADGKPVCVISHHIGCTVQSKSHFAFVRRALAALKTTFDIEKAIPTEDDQLVKAFAEWMEISAERGYTLIVLDGVENLNNSGNAHELTWLPDPPHQNDQWSAKMAVVSNFQLVVTATTGTPQCNALMRRRWRSLPLQEFGVDAKKACSRKFMGNRAKTLTDDQLGTIAAAQQTESPLFLRAVLEELVVFGKFEELDNRIDELLRCPSVVDVYVSALTTHHHLVPHRLTDRCCRQTYKIDRLQQQVDVEQVKEVLSFMWVSRAGVSAEELIALVGMPQDEFDRIHGALDGFLINRTGLLDFIDPMLREAVQQVFLGHRSMAKDYRKRLARFLEDRYQPDEDRYSEVAWQYRQANEDAKLLACITHPQAFALFRSERHSEDFMLYCRHVGKTASSSSDYQLVLQKLTERLLLKELIAEAAEMTPETVDPRVSDLVNTTFMVALFAKDVAQFPMAEELLTACMSIDEKLHGRNSTKLARDMLMLATLYVRNKHKPSDGQAGYTIGRELLDKAQLILTSDEVSVPSDGGMEEDSVLGSVYHMLGLLDMFEYFASKDIAQLDSAIVNAERAMAVWDANHDLKNKAETLNLVGTLSKMKGMVGGEYKLLQKAEECLKESLSIRESALSRSDPALGQVLNTLGDFYSAQGNLSDAEDYYHRARKVYVEGLGAKNVRGVYPLVGLAQLEAKRPEKDYDLMIRYIQQVVSIRKQLGEDHPDYTKAKQLLEDFKRQRLVVDTAAGRIGRLWKRLRHKDGAPGAVSLPSVQAGNSSDCAGYVV